MKKIFSFLVMLSMVTSTLGAFPVSAMATSNNSNNSEKIKICHKTGNSYKYMETPDDDSLSGHLSHGDFLYEGPAEGQDDWCENNIPPTQECNANASAPYFSDETTLENGENSVLVSFIHSAWTSLGGSSWIWGEDPVNTPELDVTETFIKGFTIVGTPKDSTLEIAADNSFDVFVNDVLLISDTDETNYGSVQNIPVPASMLVTGQNTIKFVVKNWAQSGGTAQSNPAGLIYKLVVNNDECSTPDPDPTPKTTTLIATKIVCNSESDLPNWGDRSGGDVNANTATTFLDTHPNCHLQPDWQFQWVTDVQSNSNPGDNSGLATAPWNLFSPSSVTDGNGSISTQIPVGGKIWVREVLKDGYIPFTGQNTDQNVSAELYCNNDHLNYDNWDWIDPVQENTTYYCVAFNAPVAPQCINEENGGWADSVVVSSQGKRKDGSDVILSRSNTSDVLGEANWTVGGSTGFYSLGFGGSITVAFDKFVPDVEGNDISIHEATNGTYPLESVKIEVSQDGDTWYLAGNADNTPISKITYIDFSGTGLSWIKFVRVTDTSNPAIFTNDADGFDLDAIDVSKEVCDQPETLSRTSDVQICKLDDQNNHLSGWTVMLKGESVQSGLVVPTNLPAGIDSVSLTSGLSYIASSVGVWNNQGGANPVDAEYSTTDGWATHMDGYDGYQTDILELQINNTFDPNSNWGAYNSQHKYAQSFIPLATGPANFRIFDGSGTTQNEGWFGDNSGTLSVDINEGYAGITGENGCITFNDVPYGTYTVDEIQQDGWSHVSGAPEAVTVDEPEETFNIVNHDDSIIEESNLVGKIKITKYECPADTVVVRSQNGVGGTVPGDCVLETGATFGYVHGAQTDANEPYPELSESITEAGSTADGVLEITNLPADGRYLVVETDGAGNKLSYPDSKVLGLYCEGDGDTSDNNDNQELTFVTDGGVKNCVAYDKAVVQVSDDDSSLECDDNQHEENNVCVNNDNGGDEDEQEDAPKSLTTNNGGGGGGNGPVNFGFVLGNGAPQGEVLGESCGIYINSHFKLGSSKNNSEQVKKLQTFLNKWLGSNIPVTGFYGPLTFAQVKKFQEKYGDDILKPWGLTTPTGIVYLSTVKKINQIECPELSLDLPPLVPWSLNPNAQ